MITSKFIDRFFFNSNNFIIIKISHVLEARAFSENFLKFARVCATEFRLEHENRAR